jgi:hypothetical protein
MPFKWLTAAKSTSLLHNLSIFSTLWICNVLQLKPLVSVITQLFFFQMDQISSTRPLQPRVMFVSKAGNIHQRRALGKCYTLVGSGLTCKHFISLETFDRDKNSSLLNPFVSYKGNKFSNYGKCNYQKVLYNYLHHKLIKHCNKLESFALWFTSTRVYYLWVRLERV